jgi:phage gp45-like
MSGWARMIGDVISALELLVTNDDGAVQLMQGQGEQANNASQPEATPQMPSMAYSYGISAHPPKESDLLALSVEGRSEQTVISAQHRPSRPKGLKEGEVAVHMGTTVLLFLDDAGKLHLGARTATEKAVLGDAFKSEHDAHIHATPFGPSGAPIVLLSPACFSTVVTVA